MESLESRQLMAVLVSVTDGDLVVTGDGQADQVTIIQSIQNGSPIDGRYFITGQNGTIINGTDNGYVEGVTDDIRVNLNGGNDVLRMGNGVNGDFIVPDDLEINTSAGNDIVVVDAVTVRDDAAVDTSTGADSLFFKGTVGGLGGLAEVDGGDNDLTINTGAGRDSMSLMNTFVRDDLNINAGPALDLAADSVELRVMNVGDDTTINTGGGGDRVILRDVGFNDDLTVNTGAGNDTVSLSACQVDAFFANLGSGDDTLRLTDTFGNLASLNGGTGRGDRLVRINSPFQSFARAGFESTTSG